MELETSNTIDRSKLKDIRDVKIDTSMPCSERVKNFVAQVGNPYCYLDNGVIVEIGYADTQVSLQERLLSYVNSMSNVGNLQ